MWLAEKAVSKQPLEAEERDREGYERQPATEPDLAGWEQVAAWPDEEYAEWSTFVPS